MLSSPSKNTYNVENHTITYTITSINRDNHYSLVDRGANGGESGDDMCIINRTNKTVSIQGVYQHQLNNIPIVTVGGIMETLDGPMIGIFHQYAYVGRGNSIHSSSQLENHKNYVDEKSRKIGGMQCIKY